MLQQRNSIIRGAAAPLHRLTYPRPLPFVLHNVCAIVKESEYSDLNDEMTPVWPKIRPAPPQAAATITVIGADDAYPPDQTETLPEEIEHSVSCRSILNALEMHSLIGRISLWS